MILAPWQTPLTVSVLVAPPTQEPLTIEEGKLRAGLTWPVKIPPDPRDALMADHIAAARSQVERDTGLALLTQTRDVVFYTLPSGLVTLPMQGLPLQEVISVTPMAPSSPPIGLVRVAPQELAPAFAGVTAGTARVKVGWIDPADLRVQAPLLVLAVSLLTAHFATAGRDAVVTGVAFPNPQGYEEAISSYRLVWLP